MSSIKQVEATVASSAEFLSLLSSSEYQNYCHLFTLQIEGYFSET